MTLNKTLYQFPKLVTIFGGSGFVGRHLAEILAKAGYRVRIAVRYPEKAYYMDQIGRVGQLQLIKANVLDKTSVESALKNSDYVIYLTGVFSNQGKNTFENTHIHGAKNVATFAKKMNIPLIYLSSLGADANSPIAFDRTKALGENAIKNSQVQSVILRSGLIYGPNDHFFNKQAMFALWPIFFPIAGKGESLIQPIYVCHICQFILAILDGRVPYDKTYELGGDEILTYRQMIDEMLQVISRPKTIICVPKTLAQLTGFVWQILGKLPLIPKLFTCEHVKMLQRDYSVSQQAIEENRDLHLIYVEPVSLKTILPTYLWYRRPQGQFTKRSTPDWSR